MGEARYAAGFASQEREVAVTSLPVRGTLPGWLAGTLVRNGPAKFEGQRRAYRHWFDGLAMLHRFELGGGGVSYANRFLDTPSYRSVRDRGRISYGEFATDPCGSLFGRFFTRFQRRPTPNAAVNVVPVGGRTVALTETPLPVEFDPQTLRTVGVVGYDDALAGQTTTAHPHADPTTGDLVSYLLRFSRTSAYQVYRQPVRGMRRELVATVPVSRPGYLHSFGVSARYAVLAEFPLVVNPLSFVLRGRPFIENFRWRPEQGTRFVVVDLEDGAVRGGYRAEPCFAFHHINAYDDGDNLVVDLCGYDDAEVVGALYLDRLRAGDGVALATPRRYRIDLAGGSVTERRLAEVAFELPRISYAAHNGRPYRYAYGASARNLCGDDFLNQLAKIDVTDGRVRTWAEDGCYPGEPVFVPGPRASGLLAEDDGVVLSVVLDARTERSFLLVLDAESFREVARAEVPQAVPFGFHGHFAPSQGG